MSGYSIPSSERQREFRRALIMSFLTECGGAEGLDLRERLLVARDVATANLALHEGDAQHLNLMIACTAQQWVFAPAPLDHLQHALTYCRSLMRAFASGELLNGRMG